MRNRSFIMVTRLPALQAVRAKQDPVAGFHGQQSHIRRRTVLLADVAR